MLIVARSARTGARQQEKTRALTGEAYEAGIRAGYSRDNSFKKKVYKIRTVNHGRGIEASVCWVEESGNRCLFVCQSAAARNKGSNKVRQLYPAHEKALLA